MTPARDRKTALLVLSRALDEGGAERFASTLLTHLNRERIKPSLCLLRDDIGYPLPPDIPLTVIGYAGPLNFFQSVLKLRDHIEKTRPDVVLGCGSAVNVVAGLALRLCKTKPAWIARYDQNPRYDQLLRKLILKRTSPRANQFVVNSHGVQGAFEECYPFTSGKVKVIGNPTDFSFIDQLAGKTPVIEANSDVPVIINVGRLFPVKRIDLLIEAFEQVRRYHQAELWICGDGPLREELEAQVDRLELGDSVRLLGFCRNPYALLRQATLFILSSHSEGLPNALIEAQGLGLPAVSTRCPFGPDEIIEDGKTGVLVPVGNARALADAISTLLDDNPRLEKMGRQARARARRLFDASHLTRQWEKLILECRVN
jgi:glycosyltransferase involved in cell wall biosynthesis